MFCTNCGEQFDGNFCPSCGTPASGQPRVAANLGTTKINITTSKQNFLIGATITVSLNGNDVAWIGDGQTVSLNAPTGENTLLFRANFRKREVTFLSNSDINVNLKWNRITGSLEALCTGQSMICH